MIICEWNYSKNNGIKDNDMKDKNLMSPKEENLMELLWDEQRPLTTAEIGSVLKGKGWNKSTLFNTIQSLLEKGYIKVSGVERSHTQYARQFEYTMTKEEYAALFLTEKGIKRSALGNIALAMTGSSSSDEEADEELIQELENIIKQLRGNRK